MKFWLLSIGIIIVGFCVFSEQLLAQTSFDASGVNGGSIIVGYDSRTCDGTTEGAIRYNSGTNCAGFCNATSWTCPSSSALGGFAGFTDLIDQTISTLVTSNILQVIVPGASAISITGAGTPQYRICSNSTCSAVIQTWTSAAGTVNYEEFVQVRMTTSASYNTLQSLTLSVSSATDTWDVTTEHDRTPNAFAFTTLFSQAATSVITSNIVLINDVTIDVDVTISGDGSPQYRTCDDASCSSVIQTWGSAAGTIANGKYLQLRSTTPASGTNTVTVNVGTVTENWYLSTNGKGYFVLSSASSNGNLGGMSGADATCVSNLNAGSWLDKAGATIDAAHVFSFLCDGGGCNNLQADTIYAFARSGSATAGGDFFITNASGRGPGSTGTWSGSNKFNSSTRFWSSRATGSSTLWPTTGQGNHCNNWSDGTAGFSGVRGDPTENDDKRWDDSVEACSASRLLLCFVNPT